MMVQINILTIIGIAVIILGILSYSNVIPLALVTASVAQKNSLRVFADIAPLEQHIGAKNLYDRLFKFTLRNDTDDVITIKDTIYIFRAKGVTNLNPYGVFVGGLPKIKIYVKTMGSDKNGKDYVYGRIKLFPFHDFAGGYRLPFTKFPIGEPTPVENTDIYKVDVVYKIYVHPIVSGNFYKCELWRHAQGVCLIKRPIIWRINEPVKSIDIYFNITKVKLVITITGNIIKGYVDYEASKTIEEINNEYGTNLKYEYKFVPIGTISFDELSKMLPTSAISFNTLTWSYKYWRLYTEEVSAKVPYDKFMLFLWFTNPASRHIIYKYGCHTYVIIPTMKKAFGICTEEINYSNVITRNTKIIVMDINIFDGMPPGEAPTPIPLPTITRTLTPPVTTTVPAYETTTVTTINETITTTITTTISRTATVTITAPTDVEFNQTLQQLQQQNTTMSLLMIVGGAILSIISVFRRPFSPI